MHHPSSPSPTRQAWRLVPRILFGMVLAVLLLAWAPSSAQANHRSDQNRDGVVDLQDVILFAENELRLDWQTFDWCQWLQSPEPHTGRKHLDDLLLFIEDYFQCHPLAVLHANTYPTRLAWGPGGRLFVTDAKVGSVFVYERQPELTPVAEIKNLLRPLGVAVDPNGIVYVGVDGRDRVEVFGAQGIGIATIGDGTLRKPSDLFLDSAGQLYVADSELGKVLVYGGEGTLLRSIGEGELGFPVGVEVSGSEVYVADQASYRIKVFDLQGNLLRSLGGPVTQGSLGYKWKGQFVRLQSVGLDATGRVHALDSHQGLIEILDAQTGAYLTFYGEKGTGPGQLQLPLDIALNGSGETAVTDPENQRVEILPTP